MPRRHRAGDDAGLAGSGIKYSVFQGATRAGASPALVFSVSALAALALAAPALVALALVALALRMHTIAQLIARKTQ